MDLRGDPRVNQPPPPPTQGDNSSDWYLFYSPRSKPSMNFIAQAKKIDAICSNINLINFDDNPAQMVNENPWLREHGLPSLVIDGKVISKKSLFDWLDTQKNALPQMHQQGRPGNSDKNNSEPSASHLGEAPFDMFSNLSNDTDGEISTDNYSSIGAKQGSEGLNHEHFDESRDPKLSLDALQAQRSQQLS